MTDNVIRLNNQGVPIRDEPHQGCIEFLEIALQDARAGRIVGITMTYMDPKGHAGYQMIGFAGGFSMLGAAQCVVAELTDLNRGIETEDA
jgi:hypothetical protein